MVNTRSAYGRGGITIRSLGENDDDVVTTKVNDPKKKKHSNFKTPGHKVKDGAPVPGDQSYISSKEPKQASLPRLPKVSKESGLSTMKTNLVNRKDGPTRATPRTTSSNAIPSVVPSHMPKNPIRQVTAKDEKPTANIYGEPQMPMDCNQRLEAAIIFLSDEGPENYPDFKSKLKMLDYEIGTNWPRKKAAGDVEYQAWNPRLYRKVVAMLEVHKARIESGARVWFEKTMFPQYPPSESETSGEYPPSREPPKIFGDVETETAVKKVNGPRKAVESVDDDDGDDDDDDGSSEGEEMTVEEYEAYRNDPWAEEMPRPEIWHRKMAPRFPFGDTPYMVEWESDRIKEDLSRGHHKESNLSWLANLFRGFGRQPAKHTERDTWALPQLDAREEQYLIDAEKKTRIATTGTRNSHVPRVPGKRARANEDSESSDSEATDVVTDEDDEDDGYAAGVNVQQSQGRDGRPKKRVHYEEESY